MKKCKSIFAIDNILKGKYPIRLNIFEISEFYNFIINVIKVFDSKKDKEIKIVINFYYLEGYKKVGNYEGQPLKYQFDIPTRNILTKNFYMNLTDITTCFITKEPLLYNQNTKIELISHEVWFNGGKVIDSFSNLSESQIIMEKLLRIEAPVDECFKINGRKHKPYYILNHKHIKNKV